MARIGVVSISDGRGHVHERNADSSTVEPNALVDSLSVELDEWTRG